MQTECSRAIEHLVSTIEKGYLIYCILFFPNAKEGPSLQNKIRHGETHRARVTFVRFRHLA